jgi:hypothetical protein
VKQVELVGLTVEAGSGAPLILLREHDAPHRVLPIFVGGTEAAAIAVGLGDEAPPRPLTHDLLVALVEALGFRVERVEVTELRGGTFVAELAMSGPSGQRRLDSRPSDAIALAVRVDAPLFVSSAVLDEAGAILTEATDAEAADEEAIDDEVARFRSFLDALDPAQFQEGTIGESPAPPTEPAGPGDEGAPPDAAAEGGADPDPGPDDPPESPGG